LRLVARSDSRGVKTARRERDPVDIVRVIANVGEPIAALADRNRQHAVECRREDQ
jgi:hypothetical protein